MQRQSRSQSETQGQQRCWAWQLHPTAAQQATTEKAGRLGQQQVPLQLTVAGVTAAQRQSQMRRPGSGCRGTCGIVAGFQLASAAGPLCDEPLWGIAFEVRLSLSDWLISLIGRARQCPQADALA